jgi:hypothetical protein
MSYAFPPSSEWQTIILGPYGWPDPQDPEGRFNPYAWTFPILPQVASGHTKTFPPRATVGPTDPDIDDTLSTANWMDLTGGQGISVINPATDMSRTWWHVADLRYTDGWTTSPEVTKARPTSYTGICTPVGTIGVTAYGLWGTHIHRWYPSSRSWGPAQWDLGAVTGPGVAFNGRMYWPRDDGYVSIRETVPGELAEPEVITGHAPPAAPLAAGATDPTTRPRVWRFGVHRQQLYAVTIAADGYKLAKFTPSLYNAVEILDASWKWLYDNGRQAYCSIDSGAVPLQLISWVDALGQGPALWAITDRGCIRLNDAVPVWEETTLWNVPPHPNWGRAALPFRPGEALWIASGGGDLTQYASNGVVIPASGPGGRGFGMPAEKRGDIVSMASDLANLYTLVQGDTLVGTTDLIEDSGGSDALYIPSATSTSSVIAGTGKGWHPLWESASVAWDPGDLQVPSEIAVGRTRDPVTGAWDFTAFWGVGEWAFSMPCRLSSYSAAQGRLRGIDRFAPVSYIELGEYHAGSINAKKLWSHAALNMKFADATHWAALQYQTDASDDWVTLGEARVTHERVVLPFGLNDPVTPQWSAGMSSLWIKPRLGLFGPGGVQTPVVQALSLSYLPLRRDATHAVFTIPLPVEVDERSGKTSEQIHQLIHELLDYEQFLHLKFSWGDFRVVLSGAAHTEIAGQDFVGALKLNVIQIPTGANIPGLIGEHPNG